MKNKTKQKKPTKNKKKKIKQTVLQKISIKNQKNKNML